MPRAQKVMISIDRDLLARVDREVDARRTTRSAFLQEAARRELGWPAPALIDAAVARGRAALAATGAFESAGEIRRERDERDARDRRRR